MLDNTLYMRFNIEIYYSLSFWVTLFINKIFVNKSKILVLFDN